MAGVGSALRRLYLSVYNWVIFYGWAQVLYYAVMAPGESGHEAVYAAVERPLQFAQTAAIMEILHGTVGLVRSPVSATLPQIGSRLFLTWDVLWSFPEAQSHILVTSLVISWSITEIIRYSFFGMKEALGFAPSWLLWLRHLRNIALGCPTNGISPLITRMHLFLSSSSMLQEALTCTITCVPNGRRPCPRQKPRNLSSRVSYPLFVTSECAYRSSWLMFWQKCGLRMLEFNSA